MLGLFVMNISFAGDIIVSPAGGIKTIKEAVSRSLPGDRIIVKGGYYSEYAVVIEKNLELIGEDSPVVDGANQGEIFTVRSDNVSISGFTVKNSGFSSLIDYAGIRLENVKYCSVSNNVLIDNYFAVYLANSSYCSVTGNRIQSNARSESSSGNGIHLWKCNNITIDKNDVKSHRDGIYLEFVTGSRVSNNTSTANLRYGLHFMFSNSDSYEWNTFRENGAGVAVMYSRNVAMTGNLFEDNWGPSSYGLLLKDISQSSVSGNTFKKNTIGIYMEGVTSITVLHNTFRENGWAMKVLGNCDENSIKNNNFSGNTFDVSTNSNRSLNFFSGNYWDKYNGYDLDKDGFGDVGYRPVSLFSMIVERTPETIILLRSFVVDILDITEKVVPVFIPETLADNRPKMEMN